MTCPYGYTSPAICRCVFTASIISMRFPTWCARAGCFRRLVRRWRYKLVSLLHTNRAGDFFLYGGLRVTGGAEHEAPVLYDLVEEFVRYHGRRVIKRLILDRGFLDGAKIGRCKKDLSMDVLIPVRKDMDSYHDVVVMAEGRLLSFAVVPASEPAASEIRLHRR